MNLFDRLLSFHKKHRWLSHVIFWLIYLLFAVGSSMYHDHGRATYRFEFISDGLYMFAEMIAAYGLAYLAIPQFIYRKRYFLSTVESLIVIYVSCVVARIVIVKICEPMAGIKPEAFETYPEMLTDITKLFYVYFFDTVAASSIFIFLKLIKDLLGIQKHTLTLEKEKAETELKLLKTQLNPHFLFNTLNNIYSLSLSSSPATSGSIARLADILDHILYRCNGQYVPLEAEIDLVKNYIELEKLRYDKRLTVNFNVDVDRKADIAPLILLSLVENAFKHGASDDTGAPVIDIHLKANEKRIIFNVSNTIAPVREKKQPSDERIGLNNLRRQLDLIYGEDYQLDINHEDKYFRVELVISLEKETIKHEKDPVLVG